MTAVQKSQPLVFQGLAGAMASYFQTEGDPNAHKLTDSSQAGVPELTAGKEWVVKSNSIVDKIIRCIMFEAN